MEVGKIVELKDDKAIIMLDRKSACADCHACEMSEDKKQMTMTALNECGGKVGDNVFIELVVEKLLFATFIVYGVPLLTTVFGFGIGYVIFRNEIYSFLLGIIFMVVTYLVIKKFDSFFNNDKYIPVAKKIV